MGNGTFGGVFCARDEASGRPLVAKCARAAASDARAEENARSYLDVESLVNSRLRDGRGESSQGSRHVAPYLGEREVNGTTYLVWEDSGTRTLEDYVESVDGWARLAEDFGVEVDEEEADEGTSRCDRCQCALQVLFGMRASHLMNCPTHPQPANILVDPDDRTLRLIDFGSACCMNSWTGKKLGYKGENKGPRSILYCAPEEFVDEEQPYAFDVYGAAVTWLQTVLSEDGPDESGDGAVAGERSACGLGDEEELFQWRLSVRDFGHHLVAWEEYAALHGSLPHGWDGLFGTSRRGIHALRLLSEMLSYSPARRSSAAEALVGPYLNPDCDAEAPPELPPAMPFSIASHVRRWKKDREVREGGCRLDDLFTRVLAAELERPFGVVLGEGLGDTGVIVTGVADGSAALDADLRVGDALLAIGSIDVESASVDHVIELLEQWPEGKPVPLLLVRDSD
ncbi:hypothetical protein ACHAWF_005958 [Thalassiosira exigua]